MKKRTTQVDRTKPSTACEPCRKRRAKCDRRRPQCSQCIRSGNTCSGYRDNLDLVIRNQNEKVFKAVQRKITTTTKPCTPSKSAVTKNDPVLHSQKMLSPNASARAAGLANRKHVPLMLKNVMASMAVNYFVTHFGHGIYLDWLPTLFKKTGKSLMLEASLEAVGALYLALREKRVELMQKATSRYSVALQEISSALPVPSRAVEDDTIASVMLVALFAAWSSPASEAARSWTHHINGAMILLDMRPHDTFNGHVIQWLLGHVIGVVQLDCITRMSRLPPQISKLCNLSVQGNWDYQRHFWSLIDNLACLREHVSQPCVDHASALEHAKYLDTQAARLARIMPLPPEIDANPDPHRIELKDCPVHYPAHRIVQALNTLRLTRLETNRLIIQQRRALVGLECSGAPSEGEALEIIRTVTEEICESVPQFLRTLDEETVVCEETDMWICSLLWAFTFAAACDLVPGNLKQRLRKQLDIFARMSDMPYVSLAASQVALGQQVPDGLHIFYIC